MRKFDKTWLAVSLVSLAAAAPAWAEDAQARAQLQQKLAGMQQYQANFTQTVKDTEGDIVHEASGQLTMARPDKLRWETEQPDETLLIADGRSVWNMDTFVEQVTIVDQQRAVQDNPVILLTTSDAGEWKKFAIDRTTDGAYAISPVDGQGQIQQLNLYFEGDTLNRLTMTDAQEQRSTLEFSDIDTQFTPSVSLFEVTVPDTYTIDDQR